MIEVKNAVMRFDDRNALDGISLTIPEGCAYGLLGSNGAGKSTLMRVLSGIYRLNGGEALIDGEGLRQRAAEGARVLHQRRNGAVQQHDPRGDEAVLQELLQQL